MTATELIDVLQSACGRANLRTDEVEVRLAFQPHWPFEYSIDSGPDIEVVEVSDEKVIYLPEGSQIGYLPGEASVSLGWRESDEDE